MVLYCIETYCIILCCFMCYMLCVERCYVCPLLSFWVLVTLVLIYLVYCWVDMNYVVLFLWERCIRLYYMLIYFVFCVVKYIFCENFCLCGYTSCYIYIDYYIYILLLCITSFILLYCILFHFTFYWYDKLICNVRCILHFCCNICNILVFCCPYSSI